MNQSVYQKPIRLWQAVLLFAFTSALIGLGVYVGIPALMGAGLSFLQAYLIGFYAPFAVIFALAIIAFRLEPGAHSWSVFVGRYRLNRMTGRDMIWTAALLVIGVGAYGGLGFTGKILASVPWLAPPGYFPAEINPVKTMMPGIFMDTVLKGQWWIIPAYFAGWFLNIFGEELLWRGYVLPRQEALYGRYTWLVHGALWTLWHAFFSWNMLAILPVAFGISFVAQRTRNTWPGIIVHGIANFVPLILIIVGVIG